MDEIREFKNTIERLKAEQGAFYHELLKEVSAEELNSLDEKVKAALEKVETIANSS